MCTALPAAAVHPDLDGDGDDRFDGEAGAGRSGDCLDRGRGRHQDRRVRHPGGRQRALHRDEAYSHLGAHLGACWNQAADVPSREAEE